MKFSLSRPRFEQLDHYLVRREYDKALAAVADELKRNPSQFNLLLRQAEILGLAGDRDKAIALYRKLAGRYAKDGFYAKAIALYKKILRLNPDLDEVHAELAIMIEQDKAAHVPLAERIQLRQPADGGVDEESGEHTPAGPGTDELKELQSSALFAAFEKDTLKEILTSTALRSYDEGDIIVTEGEPGSSLFLIVSGKVKVFTKGEQGEHIPLAELETGDFFGEVSMLTGKPRTATITAKSQVIAIELDKGSVDRIAAEHPEVRSTLEEFYERRAHETVEAVIRQMRGE
ncbi:MAG: cyclic nucleotide-binding domain-containing protein [Acidobacteria bacterium]|nr:cyclic nucleotide-binding domain-containing protein [Acidobacteriota bacterium]